MKITKEGKPKLEKNDFRIGNFVLSIEQQHIKVQDLNKCFTLRIRKSMPVGRWLDNFVKMGDSGRDSIKTYIAVIWSALSVAPDNEYMQDIIKAAQGGLSRHPDWYGVKENKTNEDGQEVPDEGKSE